MHRLSKSALPLHAKFPFKVSNGHLLVSRCICTFSANLIPLYDLYRVNRLLGIDLIDSNYLTPKIKIDLTPNLRQSRTLQET